MFVPDTISKLVTQIAASDCGDVIEISEQQREDVINLLLRADLPTFIHPLGFYHVELTEVFPPTSRFDRVRVHYFTDAYSKTASTPSTAHSHRWNLKSCVLVGRLSNQEVSFIEDPEGDLNLADLSYDPDGSETFMLAARGRTEIYRQQTVGEGAVYCQPHEVLHMTEVLSDFAVTVLATQNVAEGARVVVPIGVGATKQEVRRKASTDELNAFRELLLEYRRSAL